MQKSIRSILATARPIKKGLWIGITTRLAALYRIPIANISSLCTPTSSGIAVLTSGLQNPGLDRVDQQQHQQTQRGPDQLPLHVALPATPD